MKSHAQLVVDEWEEAIKKHHAIDGPRFWEKLLDAVRMDTADAEKRVWHGPLFCVFRPTGEPVRNSCSIFDREEEAKHERCLCEKYNSGKYEVRRCYIVEVSE